MTWGWLNIERALTIQRKQMTLIGGGGSRPRNIELKYKEYLEREVDEQTLADGVQCELI